MRQHGSIYLLKRAELAVRGCVETALAAEGLTPNQFFALLLIENGEATSAAELARAMGVTPQSVTELLGPLERRGAIERHPDPVNRRILRIELTRSGEQLFVGARETASRLETELLAGFTDEDLRELNRICRALTAAAELHDCHPAVRRSRSAGRARVGTG